MSKNIALICAAGIGARMNSAFPKQYLTLNYKGKDQSIVEITLDKFLSSGLFDAVIIALNCNDSYFPNLGSNYLDDFAILGEDANDINFNSGKIKENWQKANLQNSLSAKATKTCQDFPLPKLCPEDFSENSSEDSSSAKALSAQSSAFPQGRNLHQFFAAERHYFPTKVDNLYYCYGCGERIHTVYSLTANALALVRDKGWSEDEVNIFIHDVARPGISQAELSLLVAKTKDFPSFADYCSPEKTNLAALLPAALQVDSVKEITKDSDSGQIFMVGNLDRDKMVNAQTPQVFNLYYFFYLLNYLLEEAKDPYFSNNLSTNSLFVEDSLKLKENSKLTSFYAKLVAQQRAAKEKLPLTTKVLTDDTAVMAFFSEKVEIIPFSRYNNLKITVAEDLAIAQLFLDRQ